VRLGSSSLSASACRDAVLSEMPVKSHSDAAAQQHPSPASRSLVTARPLAQLPRRPAAQLHAHGQPAQPTRRTDRPGQEPDHLR